MSRATPAASPVAHQFDDLPQQHEADELGMWVFLGTEVMFFGGLFLAYTLYRMKDEATFAAASHELDLVCGTINTAVLLCSSLTMALAVHFAQAAERRAVSLLLAATMTLGSIFLGIKGLEYVHKYQHDLMPLFSLPFAWDGPSPASAKLFFQLYFLMTGVHAVHMLIGLAVLVVLFVQVRRGRMLGEFAAPIRMTGLYWHFVDVIWVWLFPLLYLIGAR